MSSMDMWNTVTIEGSFDQDINELPDFGLFDGSPWERARNYATPDGLTYYRDHDGEYPAIPGRFVMSGWSAYEASDIIEWCKEYTGKRPGVTVTHIEEWGGEDPTTEHCVYRDGVIDKSESLGTHLVSFDLQDVRRRAEVVLRDYDDTPIYSAEQLSANPLLQDELLAAGEVANVLRELLKRI